MHYFVLRIYYSYVKMMHERTFGIQYIDQHAVPAEAKFNSVAVVQLWSIAVYFVYTGWWLVAAGGRHGWAPASYLEPMDRRIYPEGEGKF